MKNDELTTHSQTHSALNFNMLVDPQNCQISTGGTLPYLFQTTIFSLHIKSSGCISVAIFQAGTYHRATAETTGNMPAKTIRCSKGSDLQAVCCWTGLTIVRIRWWCGVCVPCVRRENTLNPTYTTCTCIFCKFILAAIWSPFSCGN